MSHKKWFSENHHYSQSQKAEEIVFGKPFGIHLPWQEMQPNIAVFMDVREQKNS